MVPLCSSAALSSLLKIEFLAACRADSRMEVLVIVVPFPISVLWTRPSLSTQISTTIFPSSLKFLSGLMNIGLGSNVGIYAEGNGFTTPFYVMRDFFGALTPSVLQGNMGDAGYATMVLTVVTMFVGLFAIVAMAKKGIKGAVLFGMLMASVVYWIGSFMFLGLACLLRKVLAELR